MSPPPSARVVIRYRVTTAMSDAEVKRARVRLSPDERARADRFRYAGDCRDYVAAHALLREELSRSGGAPPDAWRFAREPGGRPALLGAHPAAPTSFSLSHARGIVACAVAPGVDVGVDVEDLGRNVADVALARRFFSRGEIACLERSGDGRRSRFFELWTLKEAYAKAAGVRLVHALGTTAFDVTEEGRVRLASTADPHASGWHLLLTAPVPQCRLAAAVHRPDGEVRFDVAAADAF